MSSSSVTDGIQNTGERGAIRRSRRTIAVLMDYMAQHEGSYEANFREELAAQSILRDVNLLFVYGGAIGHPFIGSTAQNAVIDLIDPAFVDGVVLLSTTVASYCGTNQFLQRIKQIRVPHLCSVGLALPGIPSIIIDNHRPMEVIVEHVINIHRRRRIAFLAGTANSAEASTRRDAYLAVLAKNGIPVVPELIVNGDFLATGGHEAIQNLIQSNLQFDAVVAANDHMAIGALRALRSHGLHVPRDVVVTGFDDSPVAALAKPPLTTVAQPFARMAERAIRLVLDQIDGCCVPAIEELPASAVFRRSCCSGTRATHVRSGGVTMATGSAADVLRDHRNIILEQLAVCVHSGVSDPASAASQLLTALELEIGGQKGTFANAVEGMLDVPEFSLVLSQNLNRAVRLLRDYLHASPDPGIEDLWHEVRDIIEHSATRELRLRRDELDDLYIRILEGGEQVSRSLDEESFKVGLLQTLPIMRIETAAISRFVSGDATELQLLVGMLDGKAREIDHCRFPATRLMPFDMYPEGRRHVTAVFPLTMEARQLGILAFEYLGHQIGQQMLRHQISAALSSVLLHQEVVAKTALTERSIQERLSTAKRMQSLSLLAGGVAHDLNNVLGPLVALPDVISRELLECDPDMLPMNLIADVESIKLAALRASQTIRDLLTLGRQGRTTKEPLDLCQAVRSNEFQVPIRYGYGAEQRVSLVVKVPQFPVVICASEPHLMRAISNLVHNAADAIVGVGEVVVEVSAIRVDEIFSAYETIDPGDYAVLSVSDNGCGIPEHELGRIFDPFFSSKQVDERRGSGLGLSIVHGVVKEHEGFIDVRSAPGVGTTFRLYFPRATSAPEVIDAVAPAPSRVAARILVVDDEPVQLRTCKRVLGSFGYRVDCLASGREAIERLEAAHRSGSNLYDLVLLDMILNEEFDGLERYEQIRRLFPDLRAIVVSGHAPPERAERAFQQGLAWLAKPYTVEALAVAVSNALSGSAAQVSLSSSPPSNRPR